MAAPDNNQATKSIPAYLASPEITLYSNGWWDDKGRVARRKCIAKTFDGNHKIYDWWNNSNKPIDLGDNVALEYGDKIFLDFVYFSSGDRLEPSVKTYTEWSGFCSLCVINSISDVIPNSGDMNPFDVYDIVNTTMVLASSSMKIENTSMTIGTHVKVKALQGEHVSYISSWPKISFTESKYNFDEKMKYMTWNGVSKVVTNDKYFAFSYVNPVKLIASVELANLTSYVYSLYKQLWYEYRYTNF